MAVSSALRLFDEVWTDHMYNKLHVLKGRDKAGELAEKLVHERFYERLSDVFLRLLPWTGYETPPKGMAGEREYDVIQFHGRELPRRLLRQYSSESSDSDSESKECKMLEYARKQNAQGGARDALCAVMAALASRSEMTWLEGLDTDFALQQRREENPCESKANAFCAVLGDMHSERVRGYFAHGLVQPTSLFRVSIATHGATPRPASLILTYLLPITEAFALMDSNGPIRKTRRKWRRRVYALQEIDKEGSGKQPVQSLRPEPQILELIRSKTPVVMLDAIAALAPRERAREHGLSEIVKAELAGLLYQAKALGQAVVFMLGGGKPQTLAQKVYLQPPFTDHGLRCGYLRWKDSTLESWASEKFGRPMIGLQLP